MPRPNRPPLALMHLGFLFSGTGTLLLGPTLPIFARQWGLTDSHSGLLIAAQFMGHFVGAIALWPSLRRSLLTGYLVAGAGFMLLAGSFSRGDGFLPGLIAFFILGLGLGQITTTVNLLAALSNSQTERRSASLSLLNFTWSAGAVLSPLVAGFYIAHASLLLLLLTFPAVAAILYLAVARFISPEVHAPSGSGLTHKPGLALPALVFYFALFMLYGGLEATLNGWLSTYTLRYTTLGLAAAAYSTSALWISFAAGRAVAAVVLRYAPERIVRAAGILLATGAALALRGAHSGSSIAICAILIGLGMGPFFPVTFSILIAGNPRPRQAGAATSNIGLGSAIFPYLTGLISTHMASLQAAMWVPVAIALTLLIMISLQSMQDV